MPPEQVSAHITAAEAELEREYRRTRTEADAFQDFRRKVAEIEPLQPRADGGKMTHSLTPRPQSCGSSVCDRVWEAYQDTILCMPHYNDEYDEPCAEHLSAELGEELATSLSASVHFTPQLKNGLIAASRRAARQRKRHLTLLDAESRELEAAQTTLTDLGEQLEDRVIERLRARPFDEAFSLYDTLGAIMNRCDALAEARQRFIRTIGWTIGESATESVLQPYLYADLDVTYPILADIAELGFVVRRMRKSVEQVIMGTF